MCVALGIGSNGTAHGTHGGRVPVLPAHPLETDATTNPTVHFQAKKYGAQVRGITLSPFQCSRAKALTRRADLEDKARFRVGRGERERESGDWGGGGLVWGMGVLVA